MARSLAADYLEIAELPACRFWLGPLKIVVPKKRHRTDNVTAGLPSVGLRLPLNMLRALLESADTPVGALSANQFTELFPSRAVSRPAREHVREESGGLVEFILMSIRAPRASRVR